MKNMKIKQIGNQAGMTLIELTVVLLVLIGLAGLSLPYVSGFISKTHNSTSADTGLNLFSAVQLYSAQNGGLPNNLNTLTAAATGFPAFYLDNNYAVAGTSVSTSAATTTANFRKFAGSTANVLSSLTAAQITSFANLPEGSMITDANGVVTPQVTATFTGGATFSPELIATVTPATCTLPLAGTVISGGTALACTTADTGGTAGTYVAATSTSTSSAFVTDTLQGVSALPGAAAKSSISAALGYTVPGGHNLIVLGVGTKNAMVGNSLASVPMHFGDKANLQPANVYSRFLLAVDVDSGAGNRAAKVVGIVHAPDQSDAWESVYSSINAYYGS